MSGRSDFVIKKDGFWTNSRLGILESNYGYWMNSGKKIGVGQKVE